MKQGVYNKFNNYNSDKLTSNYLNECLKHTLFLCALCAIEKNVASMSNSNAFSVFRFACNNNPKTDISNVNFYDK